MGGVRIAGLFPEHPDALLNVILDDPGFLRAEARHHEFKGDGSIPV